MPVNLVHSKWKSGSLVFHDANDYGVGAEILQISPDTIYIGTSTNDVTMTMYGDVTLYGDIALQDEDISVEQGKYVYLDGQGGTAFIYANQDGSVWIQGSSAEYGVYLRAPNSEIRVDNVLHFVARTLYNQLGSFWFDSGDTKFHYWDGGERTLAALELANIFTENQRLYQDNKLEFWDADTFIYANQAGSVWIQGDSTEYGVYLKAANSEIRVDNVFHFVARSAVYNQIGGFWFDSDDYAFHFWDGGEQIIVHTDANGALRGTFTVGVSGAGHDVTLYADTANYRVLFDAEGDGNKGSFEIGQDIYGIDFKCFGQAVSGNSLTWDASANTLDLVAADVASGDYAFSVYATQDAAKSDAIAAMLDATMSGTSTGDTYAVGAWLNVAASAVVSYEIRGLDIGIYDAGAAASTNAVVYGLCISTYIGATMNPSLHAMMRFNTSAGGDVPDYWFYAANSESIAYTANTTHSAPNKVGAIKIYGPTIGAGYIYVYSDAGA